MFDPNIHAVLDVLQRKKPLPIEATESRVDKFFKKPAKYLKWAIAGFFLAICLLAFCVWSLKLTSPYWYNAALVLLALANFSTLIWMAADIVPAMIQIFLFQEVAHRTRQLEVAHDFRNAADLSRFNSSTLHLTDLWLSIRIGRTRLRLGMFLGGSDKLAAVALVLGAWGVWTNFPGQSASWEQQAYTAGSAFVGGLALGGMLASVLINRLMYQRDLLSIAKATRISP